MSPLDPPLRALRQLDDPAFLKTVAWSVAAAFAAFGLLAGGVWFELHRMLGWNGWLSGLVGGVSSALLAHYLFLPVAGAVATLFVDPIAAAVERRWHPGLRPAAPAPLAAQLWDAAVLGAQILLLQAAALALTPMLPGLSLLLGYGVAAWAIGRGLFVAVAMRRMSRRAALALYAARRGEVFIQGGFAVAASLAPLANLLVPVLAVAALTHVLHGPAPGGGAGLARTRPV